MDSVNTVVLVWTATCVVTFFFVAGMFWQKWHDLLVQIAVRRNGDRTFRIRVARASMRRSVIKLWRVAIGLYLGIWVTWIQWTGEPPPIGPQRNPVAHGLILMMVLEALSEAFDLYAVLDMRRKDRKREQGES